MHGYLRFFTGTLKNETTMSSIVRKPRTCDKIKKNKSHGGREG